MHVVGVHYKKKCHAVVALVIKSVTSSHDDAGLKIQRPATTTETRNEREKGAKYCPYKIYILLFQWIIGK